MVDDKKSSNNLSTTEQGLRQAVAHAEQHGTAAQLGNTLDHLALHYHQSDKWSEASHVYQRALRVWSSVMGDTHPMLAPILANLGSVLFELGQPKHSAQYMARAVELLRSEGALDDDISGVVESALELRERMLAEEHLEEADLLQNSLYGMQTMPQEAMQTQQYAFAVKESVK